MPACNEEHCVEAQSIAAVIIIKRFIVASCEIRLVDRYALHQAQPRIRNVDTTCAQRFSYDENAAIGKVATGSNETSCNDQDVSATTEGQKLIQLHIDSLSDSLNRNAEPNDLARQMINVPTLKNPLLVLGSLARNSDIIFTDNGNHFENEMFDENRIHYKACRLGPLSRGVIEQSKYPRLSTFHLFSHELVSLLKDSDPTRNQIGEVIGDRTRALTAMYEHQSSASRVTLSRNAPGGPGLLTTWQPQSSAR